MSTADRVSRNFTLSRTKNKEFTASRGEEIAFPAYREREQLRTEFRNLQIRVVAGFARQADRDAGEEIRRREGEERRADDSACLPQVYIAEEIRGDYSDGEGGEATEQEASGGDDGSFGQP